MNIKPQKRSDSKTQKISNLDTLYIEVFITR